MIDLYTSSDSLNMFKIYITKNQLNSVLIKVGQKYDKALNIGQTNEGILEKQSNFEIFD